MFAGERRFPSSHASQADSLQPRRYRGSITAIVGCMFSGKTTMLLDRLNDGDANSARAFKPACDRRYRLDAIVSHSGRSFQAMSIAGSHEIRTHLIPSVRLIAIDEAHFFDDGLIAVLQDLSRVGMEVMARTLAVPAARFFRMRRSVSLLVSAGDSGTPAIVEGMYQSPILVQWQHAPRQARVLDVSLTEIH